MAAAGDIGRDPGTVVGDLELERVGPVAHADRGVRAPRVLERVGQGFLHDPVRGKLDADGQLTALAVDLELHRQAGLADLRHEGGQVGQGGLRREPVRGIGPQHADQAPHLGQRAAPDLLDGLQHLAGRAVTLTEDAPFGAGLDDDHRDAVRHRVVQFPCDPGALLHDRLAGGDVPLAFGQPGACVAVADDAAEEQHHDDGTEGEPDRGAAPVGRIGVPAHR